MASTTRPRRRVGSIQLSLNPARSRGNSGPAFADGRPLRARTSREPTRDRRRVRRDLRRLGRIRWRPVLGRSSESDDHVLGEQRAELLLRPLPGGRVSVADRFHPVALPRNGVRHRSVSIGDCAQTVTICPTDDDDAGGGHLAGRVGQTLDEDGANRTAFKPQLRGGPPFSHDRLKELDICSRES